MQDPENSFLSSKIGTWRDFDPKSFHILIADDSKEVRIGLRAALRREGFRVSEIEDGLELADAVAENPADLILLDVMMPGKDGLSVLREMREDPALASTYVILLTGRASLEEKVEGLNVGADDYLTKPFALQELLARVRAGIRIKALHRTLRESQETLVRQEKRATIGLLAAGIAHEFNNLMSAISGYAQLARSNDKYKERLIEVALNQVQRAQKITASLSSFAGNGMIGAQQTPMLPLVESSLCLLEKEIKNRQIEVRLDVPPDLPLVLVDKGQMQQVLLHLLLNAIQAAGQGGCVQVRGTSSDQTVIIEVDDNGPGIPDDIRTTIFDPFFTTKGALGNSEEQGTGLGLSFSMNMVQEFKGNLGVVASQLGGACLRIEIPAFQGECARRAPSPKAERPKRPARIVLVEDDPSLQEIISELLEQEELSVFSEAPPALEFCQERDVDLVLLDLQLGGPWSGRQLLSALGDLQDPPDVLVTTGSVELSESDLAPPAIGILRKPYDLDRLEEALQKALAGKRSIPLA